MSKTTPRRSARHRKSPLVRIVIRTLGVILLVVITGYTALHLSPWPGALLIRIGFDRGGAGLSQALEKHVPAGVSAELNYHYDVGDEHAYLDLFYPSELAGTERALPTIVWVHGGGWVGGSKAHIANYARILAYQGYTVVGVGYSRAPGETYPTPVKQVNTALAYLAKDAKRLHIDPARFVLAGDSAGAHIAAQLANVISDPSYAKALEITPSINRKQLVGMLLYCGPYNMRRGNSGGPLTGFLKTLLWSYSGSRDFINDSHFATASVINYVTSNFPPVFISAGNGDPLEPQSRAFADALVARRVPVDVLFFPKDHSPALPHEYQFNLDTEAGVAALKRSLAFLSARTGRR